MSGPSLTIDEIKRRTVACFAVIERANAVLCASFESAGFRCRDVTTRFRIRRAARARKARRGWR